MEIARAFFKSNIRDGYAGRENQIHVESAMSDDEAGPSNAPRKSSSAAAEEYDIERTHVAEFLATFAPLHKGPFSAVIPSLVPQDILLQLRERDPCCIDDEPRYDEFGFLLDNNLDEFRITGLSFEPFIEDSQWRLQWIAQLNFDKGDEITWENVGLTLPKSNRLLEMVKRGIPHSLRYQLWMRFAGTLVKKQQSKSSYRDIMKLANIDELATSKCIEKDVDRTLPGNACFNSLRSTGVPRLRRVLRGITYFFQDIGYTQGMGVIVAYLLLFMEEEDVFWTMVTILEDIMPATYYTPQLSAVIADIQVMKTILADLMPEVSEAFTTYDIDLHSVLVAWFVPLYGSVVHVKVLLRIWDLFFFYGSTIMLRLALGIIKINEEKFLSTADKSTILQDLISAPKRLTDIEELIRVSFEVTSSLTDENLAAERKRQLAYAMAEHGNVPVGSNSKEVNLPKQHLIRRPIRRSKSMIQLVLFGDDEENSEDVKNKNVKQTELLVDLREAILLIAHHFISVDPKLSDVSLVPDYSIESHSIDYENYNAVSRNRRRRAKALLDFERHDDDELGFRKNDIITVISQRDEHCWIGELNGLRGWFPAKFVELLDERSKQYSTAGDDSVTETITDLVRGTLCPAIKQILEHGMKRPTFLGGPCHPWLFIEEAAVKEVEKDFTSVYSRLILCKTYRLDEDGKVLTPEELLYRCVQAVNQSHDEAHAQMDVKLRSLICLGLNEQVLHLWLEVLCSCVDVVQKWYHPWSFVYSPGWVQIKCELRILSQFAFNLSADWELPPKKENSQPLKDGVRDMLVKHHLFSWDL